MNKKFFYVPIHGNKNYLYRRKTGNIKKVKFRLLIIIDSLLFIQV